MNPSIEAEVRRFIVENFLFGQDDPSLSNEDSFLDRGIIDSTGVLELVMYLDRSYGIEVEDQELAPENLDSVRRLARFIERKRAACAGGVRAG